MKFSSTTGYGPADGGGFSPSPVPEACRSNVSPEQLAWEQHMINPFGGDPPPPPSPTNPPPNSNSNSPWEPVPVSKIKSGMCGGGPKVPRVVSTLLPSSSSGDSGGGHSPSPVAEDRNAEGSNHNRTGSPSSPRGGSSSSSKGGSSPTASDGGNSKLTPTRRRSTVKKSRAPPTVALPVDSVSADDLVGGTGGGGSGGDPATTTHRRQKRLERNRESARLSRRRRKQYLDVLEERVTEYSHDLDKGRREHVAVAISTVQDKRLQLLLGDTTGAQGSPGGKVQSLQAGLARCNQELRIANTFHSQQLKSFALPPSTKFILWLTLQSDAYFRGGRAASERLSAARIGERMLGSGTDRAAPVQSMWPLICSEVGLSYEQEEKLRNFQRTTLKTEETWLDRHTAYSSANVMESAHDAAQAIAFRLGQRERSGLGVLSDEQKLRFLSWNEKNRDRIKSLSKGLPGPAPDNKYSTSNGQHVAANLYVLNHRLKNVLNKVPRAAPLVTGIAVKKLSRRPSFESLGCAGNDKAEEGLSRDNSFASSGSLKRDASEMSLDCAGSSGSGSEQDGKPQVPQITPADAQNTASPLVDRVLGHVKEIIPQPPTPITVASNPVPVLSMSSSVKTTGPKQSRKQRQSPSPSPPPFHPLHLMPSSPHSLGHVPPPYGQHSVPLHNDRLSASFPRLNVVPEEIWPLDGSADDLLMSLVDDDWAIGEGVDMEMDLP